MQHDLGKREKSMQLIENKDVSRMFQNRDLTPMTHDTSWENLTNPYSYVTVFSAFSALFMEKTRRQAPLVLRWTATLQTVGEQYDEGDSLTLTKVLSDVLT